MKRKTLPHNPKYPLKGFRVIDDQHGRFEKAIERANKLVTEFMGDWYDR